MSRVPYASHRAYSDRRLRIVLFTYSDSWRERVLCIPMLFFMRECIVCNDTESLVHTSMAECAVCVFFTCVYVIVVCISFACWVCLSRALSRTPFYRVYSISLSRRFVVTLLYFASVVCVWTQKSNDRYTFFWCVCCYPVQNCQKELFVRECM